MIRKRKADNATKIFYNLEQLKKLCAEWQTRLKLQDWTIDVKLVRYYEDIEGLVLKRKTNSKLRMGNFHYEVDWIMRVRKPKEKVYGF